MVCLLWIRHNSAYFIIIVQDRRYDPGDRINIKLSYQYRDLHHKDTTLSRPSYRYNGKSHTRKDCIYIETGPRTYHLLVLKIKDSFVHACTQNTC